MRPIPIAIDEAQMLRIDGIPVARVISVDGKITIEFCDKDRYRSACRGTRLVTIPLEELVEKIKNLTNL